MSKKIILLAGPTASGKSKLAIQLAKKIKGEIINADSMQVYKELNILTARPSKTDLNKIDHHLYGFISVKKEFSSGEWLKLAKKNINYQKRPISAVADNIEIRNAKKISITTNHKIKFKLLYDNNSSLQKKIKLEQLRKET